MVKDIFTFLEHMLKEYEVHGIAHARISQMNPTPEIGCLIKINELNEITPPTHYWLKYTPELPLVIVASDKLKTIPDSASELDPDKTLEFLDLSIHHNLHKRYTAELTPVYVD